GAHRALLGADGDIVKRAAGTKATRPQWRRQPYGKVLAVLAPTQVAGPAEQLTGGRPALDRPGLQLCQPRLVRLPGLGIVDTGADLRRFGNYRASGQCRAQHDRQQQTCRPIGAPAAGSAAAGHRDLISASHDQSVGRWYFPATCWRGCPRVPVATPGAP